MIEIKLTDGTVSQMPAADVRRLIPAAPLFYSPKLKSPYSGLLFLGGQIVPVLGKIPEHFVAEGPLESRHWILLLENSAILIQGLPTFLKLANAIQSDAKNVA